jgi:hypothetical protein
MFLPAALCGRKFLEHCGDGFTQPRLTLRVAQAHMNLSPGETEPNATIRIRLDE